MNGSKLTKFLYIIYNLNQTLLVQPYINGRMNYIESNISNIWPFQMAAI
jgi:hypothetical protein